MLLMHPQLLTCASRTRQQCPEQLPAMIHRIRSMGCMQQQFWGLQAGLAALKTTQSLADDGNTEDPLHLPSFRALAQPLPYAKHVHSKLVCSITREMMNEDNPPLVTPDGNVYSEKGIKANAAQHGGVFVCPSTGAVLRIAALPATAHAAEAIYRRQMVVHAVRSVVLACAGEQYDFGEMKRCYIS